MNNSIDIQVRVFPVITVDERTGVKSEGSIVLTKPQLQAAALVDMDYKQVIFRIYNRQGYKVAGIGKPSKHTITVDLYSANDEIIVEGNAKLPIEGA